MTNTEFESQYSKLEEINPFYQKKVIKELIAECVRELDLLWFKRLVERILLNPGIRIDIGEAARTEKQARRAATDTRAMTQAFESLKENMSENGLKDVLKSMGVNSLLEAVKAAK